MTLTDEDVLVQRAIEGDAGAFGMLYTQHLDAIYRYVYFRVGDASQAEDLTEDIFVRAWEALPTYQPGKHPLTSWLYRIAHNLVIDHQRKGHLPTLPGSEVESKPDQEPLPEAVVEFQQDAAALAQAVQQLDADQQQVIILRFVEGLSHHEVAEITGKSAGATRVIQHRALAALHALMSEREQSDG